MNVRKLKQEAAEAMAVAREPKKVILVYTAVMLLLTLLMTVTGVVLRSRISETGGLANMGLRTILSTVDTVLPLVVSMVLVCWELGYFSAVLRFGRKQYADHTDLRTGFRLFGPMLRMMLLQGVIYVALFVVSFWLGGQIFLFTPFSREMQDAMTVLMENGVTTADAMLMDPDFVEIVYRASTPLMIVVLLVFAVLALPVTYRYRMANYRLLDQPGEGALAVLRNSRIMMRGNALDLFKLDLSFWWYYLLVTLSTVVCYGDQLLPLVGVQLPMDPMVSYFLFYGIYLVLQFGICYYFRNYLEVTYVRAYEQIRPREQENAVILGNIFDL